MTMEISAATANVATAAAAAARRAAAAAATEEAEAAAAAATVAKRAGNDADARAEASRAAGCKWRERALRGHDDWRGEMSLSSLDRSLARRHLLTSERKRAHNPTN